VALWPAALGILLSAAAHAALVGAVVAGMPWLAAPQGAPGPAVSVTLISEAEFGEMFALAAGAPDPGDPMIAAEPPEVAVLADSPEGASDAMPEAVRPKDPAPDAPQTEAREPEAPISEATAPDAPALPVVIRPDRAPDGQAGPGPRPREAAQRPQRVKQVPPPAAEAAPVPDAAATPPDPGQERAAGAGGSGPMSQAGGGGGAESKTRAWGEQVREAISRVRVYPMSARARGVTGATTLLVTVSRSGRLEAVRVVESSGVASLDAANLRAARSAKLPPAPAGLDAPRLEFKIRFVFTLD
jgi:TonB family protein